MLIPSNEKSVNFFNKEIVEILKSLLLFDLVALFLFYFYSCDEGYAGARCERVDLFYLRGPCPLQRLKRRPTFRIEERKVTWNP